MQKTSTRVKFGAGSILNVLAQANTPIDGMVSFGYDDDLQSGVIVANGKIVSSKILDVSVCNRQKITNTLFPDDPGYKEGYKDTIRITYSDKKSATGKTTYDFEVMEPDAIMSFIDAQNVINNVKISDISTRLLAIENSSITANQDSGVTIDVIENSGGAKSYAIDINIDNKSIVYDPVSKQLEAKSYQYDVFLDEETHRDNVYRIYRLRQTSPDGAAKYVGDIEIPNNQVLNDVQLVKASYDSGSDTYTEYTQADPEYATAQAYIKMSWNDSDKCDTYLNMSGMVSTYWAGDYIAINNDGDHTEISVDIDELSNEISSRLEIPGVKQRIIQINTDIDSINKEIQTLKETVENNVLRWDDIDLDYA